ncbi:MAG: hypothetical protein NTV94_02925 [Planctomycetota bacterium]|nr:hypothetical protein [Planctomycetota bacterium]
MPFPPAAAHGAHTTGRWKRMLLAFVAGTKGKLLACPDHATICPNMSSGTSISTTTTTSTA